MIFPSLALSIWQPWAGLIVLDIKDIENRTWPCPPQYLGQTILVHAGKKVDPYLPRDSHLWSHAATHPEAFRAGGIVGQVRVVDCIENSTSPWANQEPGTWHWVLAEARQLPFMPCKGSLGLFKVDYSPGSALGGQFNFMETSC